MAENKMNSKFHMAMFPWLAYGHFLPYLHLSNKLAERGNEVSFLLPKGVVPKLANLNKFPNLIRFIPLNIPHVDGLPLGAETLSDIPIELESLLCTAMDQTRDQVRAILSTTKPDIVFFDFSYWIPALGRELGFKSVMYFIVCAALPAIRISKSTIGGLKYKEIVKKESSFDPLAEFGKGISFSDRMNTGRHECDALGFRTCYEIEGRFIDQLAQFFDKKILLTGPLLPEKAEGPLEVRLENWLNKFEAGSVVFCAFGSQTKLQKIQFQEILEGFELCGHPFLVALTPPRGCLTVEEAMPEGFEARVGERGMVYGGWVPQEQILNHRSVGCFVSHGGSSSMWESLASKCQIVLVPPRYDHVVHTMLMVEELKVGIRVKKREDGWISKESLSDAIKTAMSLDSEAAITMKKNHTKWREFLLDKRIQETYLDNFVKNLIDLVEKD